MPAEKAEETPSGSHWPGIVPLSLWLLGAGMFGVLSGGAAAVVQGWFAPLVLFPLLVGFVLGLLLAGWLRFSQVAYRPAAVAGVLLAVVASVAAEHYVCFLLARRASALAEQRADTQLLLARQAFPEHVPPAAPEGFADYLRETARQGRPLWGGVAVRGLWTWASWVVDALLTLAAALGTILPALRLPYCEGCRSWYRVTRAGRLRGADVQRLAEIVGFEPPAPPGSMRFRVLTCATGCGPMGLELVWNLPHGQRQRETAWLDEAQRQSVLHLLDERRKTTKR